MYGAELDLEHSFESASLICDVHRAVKMSNVDIAAYDNAIKRMNELEHKTPDGRLSPIWQLVRSGLSVLASQAECTAIAHGTDGDLIAERTRLQVLVLELHRLLASHSKILPNVLGSVSHEIASSSDPNPDSLKELLAKLPLPVVYWKTRDERFPISAMSDSDDQLSGVPSPLLRVIAFLDNSPIVTPQLLRPELLYPLSFRIQGLTWRDNAERLRFDFITTCPEEVYTVSKFSLKLPTKRVNFEYEGEVNGHIKFGVAQSSLVDDLVFSLQAAFEMPDGSVEEVPVIGNHELRLRVVSQLQNSLMGGNRRLDRHVSDLLTKLLRECPAIQDEVDDLLPMLQALTSLLATYAQEAIFKGRSKVPEPEFHRMVLRDLRNQLGQDVQDHPNQAGGITDIRFRGVIVELKVENNNGIRKEICKKYAEQAVQYAGVEARQTSIVLVLDVTTKDRPPGDIRNDIHLVDVDTHGGDTKQFPSKAFVFVVNGNVESPSSYSS